MQGSLDNINLFSLITVLSFFLLAPFTLATEGFRLGRDSLLALGVADPSFIYKQALYAALCFHAYQQVVCKLQSLDMIYLMQRGRIINGAPCCRCRT